MNKYSKYINDHIKAYNAIDTKKILLIEKVLINKIKKKIQFLHVEMEEQPQLQIIFYVILIKDEKLITKILLNQK